MVKSFLNSCFILVVCFLVQSAYATPDTIDKIVVFGDSLSDNGNFYALTSKLHRVDSNVPVVPASPPYFHGRFSNGQVWVERLAESLHVPIEDFAYGGAWAEPYEDSKAYIPPDLNNQVDDYSIRAVTDFHKSKHLYVIWAGSNDYLQPNLYLQGKLDPEHTTTHTVSIIQSDIRWLIKMGATKILIANVPMLEVIPASTEMGQETMDIERKLSKMHNQKLVKMLDDLHAEYPTVKIMLGDVNVVFADVLAHPEKYHFKNVTEACYSGNYMMKNARALSNQAQINFNDNASLRTAYLAGLNLAPNSICENQDEYLFWDHVHPSRVTHQLIADVTKQILIDNNIQGL